MFYEILKMQIYNEDWNHPCKFGTNRFTGCTKTPRFAAKKGNDSTTVLTLKYSLQYKYCAKQVGVISKS